jgi:hypothetical protein
VKLGKQVSEAQEKYEEISDQIAASMITTDSLTDEVEFSVGDIRIRAVLETQRMAEDAMTDAYRDRSGQPLDLATREPRFQRLLLSKVISKFEDEAEFTIGDEDDDRLKEIILAKLPRVMVEQFWIGYMAQRNGILLALSRERLKKSSATPSGERGGDSSAPSGESPTPTVGSPTSTKPK